MIFQTINLFKKSSEKNQKDIYPALDLKSDNSYDCLFGSFFSCDNLNRIKNNFEKQYEIIKNTSGSDYSIFKLWYQFILTLQDGLKEPFLLKGKFFDEETAVPEWLYSQNSVELSHYYFIKLLISFLIHDYRSALDYAQDALNFSVHLKEPVLSELNFYYFLTMVRGYQTLQDITEQEQYLKEIKILQKKFKTFKKNLPHKNLIIEAEIANINENRMEAIDLYEKAVELAHAGNFYLDEALASEFAAEFWIKEDNNQIARTYLINAFNIFHKWGLSFKADKIKKEHADILENILLVKDQKNLGLDLKILNRQLKSIAEEKIHRRIIEKIIKFSIDISQANKVLLIMRKHAGSKNSIEQINDFFIEAEGCAESKKISIFQSIPIEKNNNVPLSAVDYVLSKKERLMINLKNPSTSLIKTQEDLYFKNKEIKSILAIPILTDTTSSGTETIGILYLESQFISSFTNEIVESLEILCLSAAGRIELSKKAATDGLTNLYNHDYFINTLKQEISLSERQNYNLSLILIDIDHFKNFNDKCGHQVGDLVLQKAAHTIKDSCRESDIIARYGGEEFIVLLRETNVQDAVNIAERIREKVENLNIEIPDTNSSKTKVTISLGISGFPVNSKQFDVLIKKADEALYKSKNNGRNQVTLSEV